MLSSDKWTRWIPGFSALLVFGLAAAAFVLSFDAVRLEAVRLGTNERLAWLYPVIIDGAIVVFSLAVVRAKLNKEPSLFNWLMIIASTLVSLTFNASHAYDVNRTDTIQIALAFCMAVLPPLALAFGFHSLMDQLERSVLRTAVVRSIGELHQRLQGLNAEREQVGEQLQTEQAMLERTAVEHTTVQSELVELNEERTAVQYEIEKLNTQLHKMRTAVKTATERAERPNQTARLNGMGAVVNDPETAVLAYLDEHPNASYQDVADAIGKAKSTVGGYIKSLIEQDRLSKNGKGYEVK